jgi:hypothetical protein
MRSGFLDLTTFGACKAYVAKYMSSAAPTTWEEVQNSSRAGTIDQFFIEGDQFIVPHTIFGDLTWDIIGIGQDTPANANYETYFPSGKPLTLQLHDCLAARQFDQAEANYKITTQIDNAAKCVISLGNATNAAANYRFTANKNLVVGGLLRFIDTTHMGYYATPVATVDTTMSIAAGEEGDGFASIATSLSDPNNLNRVTYGSGRWLHSSVRQWLNSSAKNGLWWAQYSGDLYSLAPSTPTYATDAGFLNGMDADFLAVVGNVTKTTAREIIDGGGTESVTEKFFLPSDAEVHAAGSTTAYTYYSANGAATDAAVAWRIKYASAVASLWWLRSPLLTVLRSADSVGLTGGISSQQAYYTLARPAPCCVIW